MSAPARPARRAAASSKAGTARSRARSSVTRRHAKSRRLAASSATSSPTTTRCDSTARLAMSRHTTNVAGRQGVSARSVRSSRSSSRNCTGTSGRGWHLSDRCRSPEDTRRSLGSARYMARGCRADVLHQHTPCHSSSMCSLCMIRWTKGVSTREAAPMKSSPENRA